MAKQCRYAGTAMALILAAVRLGAQDRPLQLNGTLSTGYYQTTSRDGGDQTISFAPVGVKFDAAGYLLNPDFLRFTAQPEFNVGPQSSEAGFQGGNGIRFGVTLLGKRKFPLKFRYANIQREDVFFGSLTQVSAYSYKNRDREIGLNWELQEPRWPRLVFDIARSGSDSKSDNVLVPDYRARNQHANLDAKYEHWGWDLEGLVRLERLRSNLFQPGGASASTFALDQTNRQMQMVARRHLWDGTQLQLVGGSQSITSTLLDLPVDQSNRYANASLSLGQDSRLKGTVRAGYTSNLLTQPVTRAISSIGQTGPGAIAPDASLIPALRGDLSTLFANGTATFDVYQGLSLFGNVDLDRVHSPEQLAFSPSSSYKTGTGGVTYRNHFRFLQWSGTYGRQVGWVNSGGHAGTIRGQIYGANVQAGNLDHIELTLAVNGSTQDLRDGLPLQSHVLSTDAGLGRRFNRARLTVHAGGGWQQNTFQNTGNDFRSHGYTARASVEHRMIQLSYALNATLGNTLPGFSQLILGNPIITGVVLPPLREIPSVFRGTTFIAHANPFRRFDATVLWTQSRHHLDNILSYNFELVDARACYTFRRLEFTAGIIRSNQLWLNYTPVFRNRLYVRVSRKFYIF